MPIWLKTKYTLIYLMCNWKCYKDIELVLLLTLVVCLGRLFFFFFFYLYVTCFKLRKTFFEENLSICGCQYLSNKLSYAYYFLRFLWTLFKNRIISFYCYAWTSGCWYNKLFSLIGKTEREEAYIDRSTFSNSPSNAQGWVLKSCWHCWR